MKRVTARSNALLDGSSINVFAVTDLEDCDRTSFVVNEIDDSEVALPYPVAISVTSDFFGPVRSRVGRQPLNAGDKPFTVVP